MKTVLTAGLFFSFLTFGSASGLIGQTAEPDTASKKKTVTQEAEKATDSTDSILADVVERFQVPDRDDASKDRLQFIKRELQNLKRKSQRILNHVVGTFWVDDKDRFIDRNDKVIGIWGIDNPHMTPTIPMHRLRR